MVEVWSNLAEGAVPDPTCRGGLLHPGEVAYASGMPPLRASAFIGGRLALRKAVSRLGRECSGPVLSTGRGAPLLPPGLVGSVSHKQAGGLTYAAALADADRGWTLGVDLEIEDSPRDAVAEVVLTREELDDLGAAGEGRWWFGVLLRFAIKEAMYKAVDPLLGRYVDYREVSVFPEASGRVRVSRRPAGPVPPIEIEAKWRSWDRFILATARARNADVRGDQT